jgi:hypothetical protein
MLEKRTYQLTEAAPCESHLKDEKDDIGAENTFLLNGKIE